MQWFHPKTLWKSMNDGGLSVSSLKHKVEEPNIEVSTTVAATIGQPSNRERPKRSVTSVNALCEYVLWA